MRRVAEQHHHAIDAQAEPPGRRHAVLEGHQEVLVEGPSRTDPTLLRGRTRRNTTVNFTGTAAPGDLVPVTIEAATSVTLRGREATLVPA